MHMQSSLPSSRMIRSLRPTGVQQSLPIGPDSGGQYPDNPALIILEPLFTAASDTMAEAMDCSVGLEDCRDKGVAGRLKAVAIASILVASTLGVLIPIIGRKYKVLSPDGNFFFVTKSFAAGVILATAFVHMLPDAMETLANPCLPERPWTKFPFSGFIAMMAALLTLVVDFLGTRYYEKKYSAENSKEDPVATTILLHTVKREKVADSDVHIVGLHSHPTHGHMHGESDAKLAQVRHIVVSQVLELGIVAHSVIIGVTLGVSSSPCTIRPLIAALCFHQLFEGFALGGCISPVGFKTLSAATMAFFFAITTPLGPGVGIGIQNSYNENSPTALIVQGTFDSISAGILTYMALVDLIAADFLTKKLRGESLLQLQAFLALFAGSGAMALLAVWA